MKQLHCPLNGLRNINEFICFGEVDMDSQELSNQTSDYAPIMGESPVRNYWLDAGWGTWGFKAIPIAGKCMAETVAKGRSPELSRPFRLDRFRTFELLDEAGATAASH